MKDRINIVLLMFLVLLAGCEPDKLPDDTVPASSRRTVLLYLGTDNNFRPEAAEKIRQLTDSRYEAIDGNLLVYSDTGDRPVLVHIYHSPLRGSVADTIETYPPENSAAPATLTRVLNRTRDYCPAASYGLIILSHATGWLPAEMSEPPCLKAVIQDKGTDETYNYMELSDFADAIPYKLDFIIFDACFMASVEVAYELKDKTDYIVASPAEVLVPGFMYSSMMRHLFELEADLTAVAREFYEYYDNQNGVRRSATVSVTGTAGLEALAEVCHSAFDAESLEFQGTTGQSLRKTSIENIQCFGFGNQKIYFDLGSYIKQLSPERYDDFRVTLEKCIVYKANTGSYYSAGTGTLQIIREFGGLSVYIPQPAYPEANEACKKLKWAARTRPGPVCDVTPF
jgi:hypothetical protein